MEGYRYNYTTYELEVIDKQSIISYLMSTYKRKLQISWTYEELLNFIHTNIFKGQKNKLFRKLGRDTYVIESNSCRFYISELSMESMKRCAYETDSVIYLHYKCSGPWIPQIEVCNPKKKNEWGYISAKQVLEKLICNHSREVSKIFGKHTIKVTGSKKDKFAEAHIDTKDGKLNIPYNEIKMLCNELMNIIQQEKLHNIVRITYSKKYGPVIEIVTDVIS